VVLSKKRKNAEFAKMKNVTNVLVKGYLGLVQLDRILKCNE